MTLFATTALTGLNGEPIGPDQRIPDSWPVDHPFVRECIEQGFIVDRVDETPLPATIPAENIPPAARRRGNRPNETAVDVGGVADQTHEGSA